MKDASKRNWNRLENQSAIGMEHFQKWHLAVAQQANRALDTERPHSERTVDGYLFAQALRQVLRAAEMVAESISEENRQQAAKNAIAEFNSEIPGAKTIRDVLDHFDDYARGLGNLSHPGIGRAKRIASEEAAMMFEPEVELPPEGGLSLRCGDHVLDVAAARVASERLLGALCEAIGLVESDIDSAWEAMGSHTVDNPVFIGFAIWVALVDKDFTNESAIQIRMRVTPESTPAWGDFSVVRNAVAGYGVTTKATIRGENVADVKLVPESDRVRMATTEIVFTDALWMTLQRRPDLDGGWYMHSIAKAPCPLGDLPDCR